MQGLQTGVIGPAFAVLGPNFRLGIRSLFHSGRANLTIAKAYS
jgi:hypothetical protein